jgi:8-oxo-dGTP pyrophosphatase MutT (NUDIX family)
MSQAKKCAIFQTPPPHFHPTVQISACYCEYEGKVLLLKRHISRSQGETWGVVAGKMEVGEDPPTAMLREIQEEIGVTLGPKEIAYLGKLYIQQEGVDYIYHMFHTTFHKMPAIHLSDEHTEHRWVTVDEAQKLPLIGGGLICLQHYKTLL